MGAAQNGESRWTDTSVILGLQKHIQTATALTDPALGTHSQQLASHIATVQSRRNRYAVVRRLRRNNSSINWPADRPFPSVEAELNVPTSQTAGDLLLPSKDVLMEKTRRAQEQENMQILNDLFVWIEQNNVEQIVEHHQKLALLKEELSSSDQSVRSEIGLNPLDYAVLLASPQTIALLIMLGFRPGAMLSVALEHGPANVRVTDPMKFFLTRRIGDVEAKISTAQVCLDTAVSRANAYSLIQRDPNVTDWDQSAMSEAFTEVAQKEMDLQRAVKHRDKLVELRNALDRYPPTPPAPSKVVLMVYSARSILVRVSPPRQSRLRVNVTKSTTVVESSELRDTTSCESSSPETGRSPFEGRKVAGFEIDSYGLLVIRYRIEWSLSADFQNDVFSCTVAPPIRLTSIVPDSKKPDTSARLFVRTGFYELDGFQSGQNVYVRVYAFTVRGWSEPCYAQPRFVAPSSWIDALQRSKENSETTEKTIPLRYGAEIFSEKFQALKKLLDQQLLIWTYRQPSTSNPCEAIAGSEEGGKRTRSPMIQRKRSFRFPFTTKGMKFVRQTKTGVYLALVCHSTPSSTVSISDRETLDKSQLILVDDFIPMVCVTKEEPNLGAQTSADMNWFSRLLAQPKFGTDLQLISENLLRSTTPANLQFRFLLLTALQRMQIALGTYDVGVLYPDWFSGRLIESNISSLVTELSEFSLSTTGVRTADDMTEGVANTPAPSTPVSQPETSSKSTQNSLILVLVKHVQNPNDVTCSGGFRWYPLHKFLRQNKLNPADFTLVGTEVTPSPKISVTESESGGSSRNVPMRPDLIYLTPELHLLSNLDVLLYYSERRQNKLDPGLYVSLIQMHAHFDHQAKILSSKTSNVIHMLPVERVRRRTHVCRSEWNTLYNLLVATDPDAVSNPGSTTHMVVNEPYALRFCRKLHNAWIRLAKRLNYTDDELLDFRFYLPEVIQISPQHALILIFPKTDQVCLPPGHSTTPPPSNCSWIFMAYFERNLGMIYDPIFYNTASSLMSMLEVLIPMSTLVQRQCIADSELGQCVERTNTLQSIYHQVDSAFQEKRWLSEVISAARDRKRPHALTLLSRTLKMFVDSVIRRMDNGRYGLRVLGDLGEISLGRSDWKDVLYLGSPSTLNEAIQIVERKTNTHEVRNLLSVCHIPRDRAINEVTKEVPPVVNHDRQVSVVRVYAGYATGLGSGASVKVLISVRATARDIVEVVVAKLNRTLEAKRQHLTQKHRLTNPVHVPTFETIESDRFCLTVSLGTTERLIPDTIRPLLLQEPWRSGKLYVRLIHELQQYISSNSPTRLYLAVEDQIAAISKDNLETVSFLLSPMRSERAKFSSTEDVFHWVKKSGPPTIYMDGRPVK
ncbi:unnamed protein product [Echinostoma caproni]|uniref:Ras-associating domain-containing protein n=1 Tax=Echinostoma caproni TaxID=27848 RepID=A0A183AC11_9TREM|nr:unnamed protein product [Echinostoma caproni]